MAERYSFMICASLSSVEAIVSDRDSNLFLLDSIWAWASAREPAVGGSGRCILVLLDVDRRAMLGGEEEGEGRWEAVRRLYLKRVRPVGAHRSWTIPSVL